MDSTQESDDVPVLTQVVDETPVAAGPDVEALAEQLERTLLERLRPEVDRVAAQAAEQVRAELALSVVQMVREAVATSVSKALGVPRRG